MARYLHSALRATAYATASVDLVLAPIARFSNLVTERAFQSIAIASAGIAALLFLTMLFDPAAHRAINAANRAQRGDDLFRPRWRPLFDPNWGVFGAKLGTGYLVVLRVASWAVFALALLANWRPASLFHAAPLVFAALALTIAILLTLDQLKIQKLDAV